LSWLIFEPSKSAPVVKADQTSKSLRIRAAKPLDQIIADLSLPVFSDGDNFDYIFVFFQVENDGKAVATVDCPYEVVVQPSDRSIAVILR
jgi:hypothetical protein